MPAFIPGTLELVSLCNSATTAAPTVAQTTVAGGQVASNGGNSGLVAAIVIIVILVIIVLVIVGVVLYLRLKLRWGVNKASRRGTTDKPIALEETE